MAVMLSPELSKFLNMIGFEWPEGNEDRVFDYGRQWLDYGGRVDGATGTMQAGRDHVLQNNRGQAIDAFRQQFDQPEGVADVGRNLGIAGTITGGCCTLIAGAIIALKIAFVVNLVIFAIQVAQALAAAIPTLGASTTLIPLFQILAQRAIQFAINMAIEMLLGG